MFGIGSLTVDCQRESGDARAAHSGRGIRSEHERKTQVDGEATSLTEGTQARGDDQSYAKYGRLSESAAVGRPPRVTVLSRRCGSGTLFAVTDFTSRMEGRPIGSNRPPVQSDWSHLPR